MVSAPAVSSGVSSDLDAILAGRDTRWYKGYHLKLTLVLLIPLVSSATNGYDGSMMNGLQTLESWQSTFNHPRGGTLGLFNAIQTIGMLIGLPFAPWVSDHLGRRAGIALGASIMIIGTILQTAAQNMAMFIVARALIGCGCSFAAISSPVLVTELAFPSHRAPLTSLYNSSWYLGSIIAGFCVFGTFRIDNNWSWRIPSLLQGIVPVFQLLTIWFIPESPRWLVAHGHEEKAAAILTKYHCGGNAADPLLAWEMAEIKTAIELDAQSSTNQWKQLFTDRGNLRRLRIIIPLAFFSQWSGNGLVSYYLTLILSSIGITSTDLQTLINLILQIYNYFWAIVGAMAVDRTGRRFLFLTSTGGMCIAFVCWTICSALYAKSSTQFDPACLAANAGDTTKCIALNANKNAGHAVIAFIFLFYGFYDIAMTPLIVAYPVEILPYGLRSKGLMVVQVGVSASLVFNQYVNPIALDAIKWKYYIVFCVFLAFEFLYCYFFVLETRGVDGPLPLEEIAALFDGPGYYGFQKRPALHVDEERASSASSAGEKDLSAYVEDVKE